MQFTPQFHSFIENKTIPASDQGKSALLTESRSVILAFLELQKRQRGGTPAASLKPTAPANEQKLAAAVVDEQERRAAAALIKTRADLDKMTPQEVGKFFKSGGKLTN
jgi:hypothetical protein